MSMKMVLYLDIDNDLSFFEVKLKFAAVKNILVLKVFFFPILESKSRDSRRNSRNGFYRTT